MPMFARWYTLHRHRFAELPVAFGRRRRLLTLGLTLPPTKHTHALPPPTKHTHSLPRKGAVPRSTRLPPSRPPTPQPHPRAPFRKLQALSSLMLLVQFLAGSPTTLLLLPFSSPHSARHRCPLLNAIQSPLDFCTPAPIPTSLTHHLPTADWPVLSPPGGVEARNRQPQDYCCCDRHSPRSGRRHQREGP
jgi:hypothetical protein